MKINKTNAVAYGAGISLFCGVFASVLLWILQSDWQSQRQQLQSGQQLIVLSYSSGYIPGVIAGLMIIALLFIGLTVLLFAGEKAKKLKSALIRFCSLALLFSLGGMFFGEIYLAHSWDKLAINKGYLPCPVGTLLFNRVTYTAWVRNEALCYNSDVRRIISRGTPEETKQVEQYWQAQQRQRESRLKRQQG
jgi:hypothetical protein